MWCGTLIFASQNPEDEGFVTFLTILVAALNIGILTWLFYQLVAECLYEYKDSKAAKAKRRARETRLRKSSKTLLGYSVSAEKLGISRNSSGSGTKSAKTCSDAKIELCSIKPGGNPLYKGGKRTAKKSASTVDTNPIYNKAAKQGGEFPHTAANKAEKEIEVGGIRTAVSNPALPVFDAPGESCSRLFDEATGQYYLYNASTGESKWEVEEEVADEEDETEKAGGVEDEQQPRQRFKMFYTDDGEHAYYVPELGGEALWHLPEGAELVAIREED